MDSGACRQELRIGDRVIGDGRPCYIIAEVGVNHNGKLSLARQLVDAALKAGADAVKFQKRKLSELYQRSILDHPRQGEQGLQYILPLLVEFELSDDEFRELVEHCKERGVQFLCTPWDFASVDFLETLQVLAYKIGSPDMTNLPLIEYVAATHKPLLLSTGMSTEDEIRRTLALLAELKVCCGLFHCSSTYPAVPDEINLRFMQKLREWSRWPVGYSGHENGIAISVGAVAMGACMLERHITLDRAMRGPDHSASLEPEAFAEFVRSVREMEAALGVPHRWMTRGEVLNRRVLGKSLVAAVDIRAGAIITREMVTAKSPGMGLSPQLIDQLIGRRMGRGIFRDEAFLEADLRDTAESTFPKPVDVGLPWGIIARFTDMGALMRRFAPAGMSFIEFHVSDRDLDVGIEGFRREANPFDLVVHAPEYFYDQLVDLCSADAKQRSESVARIQEAIHLARQLSPYFTSKPGHLPRLIVHVGGMSPKTGAYDRPAACDRLLESLSLLDTSGVELLLENLPPFPWYFGGRWAGHVLTDAETTHRVCSESGFGLCFDTSHAVLECNRSGQSLIDFARRVLPHIRHVHIADGAGVSGEGLQIGEGQINFVELMSVLIHADASCTPEVWLGHHWDGRGFQTALERLTEIVWATRALGRAGEPAAHVELQHLIVPLSATIFAALQTIDANLLGTAFVVDERGEMLGLATDGDIRRGLLAGKNLTTPITEVMTRDFVFALDDMTPEETGARLSARFRVVPVLDSAHRLVSFVSIYQFSSNGPSAMIESTTKAGRR